MLISREAACHCGQLQLEVAGDPLRVSVCNCLDCQRRTGSAFGVQAAFPKAQVRVLGSYNDFSRVSDQTDRKEHVFHFCPNCGSQVFWTAPTEPDLIVVAVGAFADPSFPPPVKSGYDSRRHPWVRLPDSIERHAPELWDTVRPLYEAGQYAEAVDKGRTLIAAHPGYGDLYYNLACCESLAGQTAEALDHLGNAVELIESLRGLIADDPDFDALRAEPRFQTLTKRQHKAAAERTISGVGEEQIVVREPTEVMLVRVADEPAEIKRAWATFESQVGLRGRKFYGAFDPVRKTYSVCTVLRPGDDPAAFGAEHGTLPGGRYACIRLTGEPPEVYEQIGPTARRLAQRPDVDRTRPTLEFYRRHNVVDVLVPIA